MIRFSNSEVKWMVNYDPSKINHYSKYVSATEDELFNRTLNKIKNVFLNNGFRLSNQKHVDDDGLVHSYTLKDQNGNEFTFFVQGSFANGTCIRQESDVDIAIICESTFRGRYPVGKSASSYGFTNSSFSILDFKKELVSMLKDNGFDAKSGNKCINVDYGDSRKKDFDIVPCLRYRDYSHDYWNDPDNYVGGVLIKTDDGQEIINYPEQSRAENIKKNNSTNYYYKKVVRVLKNIMKDMEEENFNVISSFELECIISNVDDTCFRKSSWVDDSDQLFYICRNVLIYLQNNIRFLGDYYETNHILRIYSNPNRDLGATKTFLNDMCAFAFDHGFPRQW